MNLLGGYWPMEAFAFCTLAGDTSNPRLNWRCGVPCDGGGFDVYRATNGNVYLRNRGVLLDATCGGNPDAAMWLEADAQNTHFRLEEVPCSP